MTLPLSRRIRRNNVARQFEQPRATRGQSVRAAYDDPMATALLGAHGEIIAADRITTGRGIAANPDPRMQPGQEAARQARRDRKTSADELNALYGHLGLTFDRPMNAYAAELMAEQKKAELLRDNIVARGPSDAGTMALQFGAGLLAAAVDPIELGVSLVPGLGQARRLSVGAAALRGAGEAAVINAALEPLYLGASRQMQLDYTLTDALFNVGVGAALGGFMSGGVAAIGRLRGGGVQQPGAEITAQPVQPGRVEIEGPAPVTVSVPRDRLEIPDNIADLPRQTQMAAFRASVAQMLQGRTVRVAEFLPPQFRAQRIPANAQPTQGPADRRPLSLLRFLSDRGVRDEGGELAQMGVETWHRQGRTEGEAGFRRRVMRDDGIDLDTAAERAHEFGYIENRSISELLDAIDREMQGQRVVSRNDLEEEQAFIEGLAARDEAAEIRQASDALQAEGIGASMDEAAAVRAIANEYGVSLPEAHAIMRQQYDTLATEGAPDRDYTYPDRRMEPAEEFDPFDADEGELVRMIDGYRAAGQLTEADERELADAALMQETAAGYADATEAAAACLAR